MKLGMQNLICVLTVAMVTFRICLGSGKLQITLQNYVFEMEEEDPGSWSPDETRADRMPGNDYIKTYQPEWKLESVYDFEDSEDTSSSAGTGSSDVRWPFTDVTECQSPTKYRFVLCLDYEESYDPLAPCALERVQTDVIPVDPSRFPVSILGRETISFRNLLGLRGNQDIIPNPLGVHFSQWLGNVRVSVYVTCCGAQAEHQGQCDELLHTTITSSPLPLGQGTRNAGYIMSGRATMYLSVSASCDPDYYGPACDVLCDVEASESAHAFCNSSTGLKQCFQGWEGSDCQTDVDECKGVACRNGGTCVNGPGTFSCTCPIGTRGRQCEQRFPVCHLQPCHHQGTCLDTIAGVLCFCMPGFDGQWCNLLEGQGAVNGTPNAGRSIPATLAPATGTSGTETSNRDIDKWNVSGWKPQGVEEKVTTEEQNSDKIIWRNWYLAIILGILLILVFVIVIVFLLYRTKVRKRYKVSNPLPVPQPSSSTGKPRVFTNAVYQRDDPHNIIPPSRYQQEHLGNIMQPRNVLVDSQNQFIPRADSARNSENSDVRHTVTSPYAIDDLGNNDTRFRDGVNYPMGFRNNNLPVQVPTRNTQKHCKTNTGLMSSSGTHSGSSHVLGQGTDRSVKLAGSSHRQEGHRVFNGGTNYKTPRLLNGQVNAGRSTFQPIEHEYEDIDREATYSQYKPVPKPRSINGDALKSRARQVFAGEERSPYGSTFDQSSPNVDSQDRLYSENYSVQSEMSEVSVDPGLILKVHNEPPGFAIDGTDGRPVSLDNKSYCSTTVGSIRQSFSTNSHYQNQIWLEPPVSQPKQLLSPEHHPSVVVEEPNISRYNVKNEYQNTQQQQTPHDHLSIHRYANSPFSTGANQDDSPTWYPQTDALSSRECSSHEGVDAFLDDSRALVTKRSRRPPRRPQPDPSGTSHSNSPPRSPQTHNQARRRSEPLSERLFRRRRTSELREETETPVDVDWWSDTDEVVAHCGYPQPPALYSVSSFV